MILNFLDPWAEFSRVRSTWIDLCADCQHSYFQAWPWIENWLVSLENRERVRFAVVSSAGEPIAVFFVGQKTIRRHGFVGAKCLFLNQTGNRDFDSVCVEYNRILVRRHARFSFGDLAALLGPDWEELRCERMDDKSWERGNLPDAKYRLIIEARELSPFVNLQTVRETGDYLALLSPNSRAKIRRAVQLHQEKFGPIHLQVARTKAEALVIYDQLVKLHQSSWNLRNQPGAFASQYFDTFHRRLIHHRFESGEVQLVRATAGTHTLGCLYNFVYQGDVFFYQSGICTAPDNRLRPGLVCHSEAIRFNAKQGFRRYDFLAGMAQYKQSLATDSNQLSSIVIQRTRLKFQMEALLRRLRRKLRSAIQERAFAAA